MAEERRFELVYSQKTFSNPEFKIFVDRHTGVNYLVTMNGTSSSGLTPLLKADGTPVITPVSQLVEE